MNECKKEMASIAGLTLLESSREDIHHILQLVCEPGEEMPQGALQLYKSEALRHEKVHYSISKLAMKSIRSPPPTQILPKNNVDLRLC